MPLKTLHHSEEDIGSEWGATVYTGRMERDSDWDKSSTKPWEQRFKYKLYQATYTSWLLIAKRFQNSFVIKYLMRSKNSKMHVYELRIRIYVHICPIYVCIQHCKHLKHAYKFTFIVVIHIRMYVWLWCTHMTNLDPSITRPSYHDILSIYNGLHWSCVAS